jgi:hypothetical protein
MLMVWKTRVNLFFSGKIRVSFHGGYWAEIVDGSESTFGFPCYPQSIPNQSTGYPQKFVSFTLAD